MKISFFKKTSIAFAYMGITLTMSLWGMGAIDINTIQNNKDTFSKFVTGLKKKYNAGKKLNSNPITQTIFKTGASLSGYSTETVAHNLAYLERFFKDKTIMKRYLDEFGNENHIESTASLYNEFCNATTQDLDTLSNIFHEASIIQFKLDANTSKDEIINLIKQKQDNQEYVISNDQYYSHMLCSLFVTYVFQQSKKKK